MTNWYSEPGDDFDWYIAGFGSSQNLPGWTDVEDLASGLEGRLEGLDWEVLADSIADSDMVVLAHTNEDGETEYWTVHGPFAENHDFADDVEDFIERYAA
jgi:hypothetical protein